MEIFFALASLFMLISLGLNLSMAKKIRKIDGRFDPLYRKNEEMINLLYGDIDGVEKAICLLSQKVEAIPNIIQEDIHRSSLSLKELIEPNKPIKQNNWDSVRQAFKGPVRVDLNE